MSHDDQQTVGMHDPIMPRDERYDLPNAAYHGMTDIVGSSHLKSIARSPAHYWAEYLDPQRAPREEKPAFALGTAIHAAILEPERFARDYAVAPAGAPRRPSERQLNAKKPSPETVAAIQFWADFDAANAGRNFLSAEDHAACLAIRRSVEAHDLAQIIFDMPGRVESSLFWNDVGGDEPVACKCRPDFLTDDSRFLIDIKSTEDARQTAFARDAYNYRYYVQAPWYLDGVLAVRGVTPELFIFLVVEKSPPYAIAAYYADQSMIDAGRHEAARNLRTLRACRKTGEWPAYPTQVMPLALPAWAAKQELYAAI